MSHQLLSQLLRSHPADLGAGLSWPPAAPALLPRPWGMRPCSGFLPKLPDTSHPHIFTHLGLGQK